MIKTKQYGETLKEKLLASAQDRLFNFLLAKGSIRGVILKSTRMVNEMRWNHELGILETLVLGHAYMAAGLMSANLKGNDRLSLQIECSGPIKGLVVEANAFGEVRGYLKNVPIPLDKPLESFNLSPFFGAGFLSMTKYLEDAKQPFTGKVMMENGSVAKDLALYHLKSEQIPTAFSLSVKFDKNGEVTGAGGLFIQAMPGADENTIAELEKIVVSLPSLGELFSTKNQPDELVRTYFSDYKPKILSNRRIEFMCHCNADGIKSMLSMLPVDDLKEIMRNGPFPVEIKCHNCNTAYRFDKKQIEEVYERMRPDK